MAQQPRSLKSRALQLLSQREHSPVELRRKLLVHANAVARARAGEGATEEAASQAERPALADAAADPVPAPQEPGAEAGSAGDAAAEIEGVLSWLEARGFLSSARFAESRVHARQARFGNLRIRHELAQHQVELSSAQQRELAGSELARARAVRERRFAAAPGTSAERARQARFLAGRGFSAEVIRKILREAASGSEPDEG